MEISKELLSNLLEFTCNELEGRPDRRNKFVDMISNMLFYDKPIGTVSCVEMDENEIFFFVFLTEEDERLREMVEVIASCLLNYSENVRFGVGVEPEQKVCSRNGVESIA